MDLKPVFPRFGVEVSKEIGGQGALPLATFPGSFAEEILHKIVAAYCRCFISQLPGTFFQIVLHVVVTQLQNTVK